MKSFIVTLSILTLSQFALAQASSGTSGSSAATSGGSAAGTAGTNTGSMATTDSSVGNRGFSSPSLHGDLNDSHPKPAPKFAKSKSHVNMNNGQSDTTRSDMDQSTSSPLSNPSQQPATEQPR